MSKFDLSKQYNKYINDVLSHKIVACENIYLACKRSKEWFKRDDIYFDYEDVDKKIRFISNMRHFTGQHNGKRFILLDWQAWCISQIFGWKHKDTGYRVTKNVLMVLSRKNGKTAFAAAIGLCGLLCDKEPNAEIDLVANNRSQANIAFEMAYNFSESLDPKKKYIRRLRSGISVPKTKSKMQVLCSDSMGLDGYNSSIFIQDEMHAAKNWDLYNVMKSSQGMRTQPLAIVITTAGFLLNGYPCYDYCQTCKDILKGNKNDDTTFSAIFQLDEDDDWKDENVWKKCCPSLGQTVLKSYMQEQVQAAENNVSLEVGVKTKTFNMWCQSAEVWLPDKYITDAMQKFDFTQFDNYQDFISYGGVDLASVSDLTAYSQCVEYDGKYYVKTKYYIPSEQYEESGNGELYRQWQKQGYLVVNAGNCTDFDYITNDMVKDNNTVPYGAIGYDKFNATQWAINCTELGLPLEVFSQTLGYFNQFTKAFEILLKQGKVVLEYNPITRFCFQNAALKYDFNSNCKPVKGGGNDGKIDGVISIIEAIGECLIHNNYFGRIEIF